MAKKNKGVFIVIDGTDGSGKKTQVELLAKTLTGEGYKVKIADFPEYEENFFGKFIGHCLTEQYYNWLNVHPKIASVVYAADRWESKEKIDKWLVDGNVVIANRYVSSNQIHQGGKIADAKKRKAFIAWLDELEYGTFKIPKPDLTLYLSLPIDIVLELIAKRESSQMKRKYLKKNKDVHENDVEFLTNSRRSAQWLPKILKNFKKIECSKKGEILTREAIHEMIYKEVKSVLK
jgi:dTMP kinase